MTYKSYLFDGARPLSDSIMGSHPRSLSSPVPSVSVSPTAPASAMETTLGVVDVAFAAATGGVAPEPASCTAAAATSAAEGTGAPVGSATAHTAAASSTRTAMVTPRGATAPTRGKPGRKNGAVLSKVRITRLTSRGGVALCGEAAPSGPPRASVSVSATAA